VLFAKLAAWLYSTHPSREGKQREKKSKGEMGGEKRGIERGEKR